MIKSWQQLGGILLTLICGCGTWATPALAQAAREPGDAAQLELFYDQDELVEAASGAAKPISQVAENVTIVTAQEIEAMNAHTVGEVLNRVAGVFFQFDGRDFAGPGDIHIHGSEYEHVLVLVDGFRWDYVSADYSNTNPIPVGIIQRIEVIKGAASSTWGSALGGVVNIITKDTGTITMPKGTVSASYGEGDSQAYNGEVAGRFGALGYYLYAGSAASHGLTSDERYFDNRSLYSKFKLDLSPDVRLTATLGSTGPENKYGYDPAYDLALFADEKDFFYTANLDARLSQGLNLNLALYNFADEYRVFGKQVASDSLWWNTTYDGRTRGASGRLVCAPVGSPHTVVMGAETEQRQDRDKDNLADFQGARLVDENHAFYLNDTIAWGRFTLVPGLRYDWLKLSDNQLSPSLGMTFRWSDTTLLRAGASRGFRKPTVGLKIGDPYFTSLSPQLESETIITYQAGLETTAVPYVRMKVTLFRHDTDHTWVWDFDAGAWGNDGQALRQGLELEARTNPWHHLSLAMNGTYARMTSDHKDTADLYNANLTLEYDDPRFLRAQLFGHYVHWGEIFSDSSWNGSSTHFTWDLNLARTVWSRETMQAEIFGTGHNLTNTSQYYSQVFPNAGCWVEAGLRFRF